MLLLLIIGYGPAWAADRAVAAGPRPAIAAALAWWQGYRWEDNYRLDRGPRLGQGNGR